MVVSTVIRVDLGIEVFAVEIYLGSNREIASPCLWVRRTALDFGAGAYFTDDLDQARRWAILKTKRSGMGSPLVSVFDFDDMYIDQLAVLSFESLDLSWFFYVADNRRSCCDRDDWDMVIGPAAGDQAMPALGLCLRGYLTAEAALGMLSSRCLCRQYCFKTQSALDCLTYRETIAV